MGVKVKKNLRHLETVKKNLEDTTDNLGQTAEFVIGEIIDLWGKGKGATGTKMKKLSTKYGNKKEKSGRKRIRDLNWTGDLYRALFPKKEAKDRYALTFSKDAMGKAVGNYNKDNRMFTVGKKLRKESVKFFNHLIYPWR